MHEKAESEGKRMEFVGGKEKKKKNFYLTLREVKKALLSDKPCWP